MEKPEDAIETLSYCLTSTDGQIIVGLEARQDVDPEFPDGTQLEDRYHLITQIGRGGMGRVYLARDRRLDRQVAIKVLFKSPEVSESQALIKAEARLGAGLQHPGIATVYDFGFAHERPYTVFEYVEGKTLRRILLDRGVIPLSETRLIIKQLAAALDYAHSKGVVHRDLKPENVCLTPSGQFKILDLGLARDLNAEVGSGRYSGTPAYSSPEQASCQSTDGRSDQYSLAVLCFELLTGRRPFLASTPAEMLLQHIRSVPPDPRDSNSDVPERVAAAVLRALSKHPGERFATCQEFALAIGDVADPSAGGVLSIADTERRGFYLCHAAEDSILAGNLAKALEAEGYSSWRYQRDALPGASLVQQTRAAIGRCQGILVLISRAFLQNTSLLDELEYAHQLDRTFFSLLLDMSQQEFDAQNAVWRSMLGPGALLPLSGRDRMVEVVDRLVSGAQSVGIAKQLEPRTEEPKESDGAPVARRWATDANQISIRDLDRVVYRTDAIDEFLNSRSKHFLSATKGFGKTLLLTYKRDLLTRQSATSRPPLLIPEGRPYLDFMSELRSLSERYRQPLMELNTTKRLWSAALRISVLSYHDASITADEMSELEAFPKRIARWLQGTKIEPTVVFKEFTGLPVSELNRLIDQTENFLDYKIRAVHSGAALFVDKVDQAVSRLPRQAWINVQAGLVEAAWEMMNCNPHIRIYATIREEAFANYESDVKPNLLGATTRLAYSGDELAGMLDQLSRCYEGFEGFHDFAGLNVIRHPQRPDPEDSYQFVRRHTFGRPRDLVAMASSMSANHSTLNESRFREIVHQTASTGLVANVFDEVRVFLSCLHDRENRERFLASLPDNILTYDEAIAVSEDFNGLSPGTLQHFDDQSEQIYHPFRDLYLAGLLGVIDVDQETGTSIQRFRQPHDVLRQTDLRVPRSDVYLIHPALNTFIAQHRSGEPYCICNHVRIGHLEHWDAHDAMFCEIEKRLNHRRGTELYRSGYEMLGRIHSYLKSGQGRLQPFIAGKQWTLFHTTYRAEDELIYWFEELLSHVQR